MRYTLAEKLLHILRVTYAWLLAYALFTFVRLYGINDPEMMAVSLWSGERGILIWQLVAAALLTGVLYGFVDLLTDGPKVQSWSFYRVILVKGILHLSIVLIALITLLGSKSRLDIGATSGGTPTMIELLGNKSFQVFIVFFIVTVSILNAYQQVSQKFGRGVLLAMMLGRFHKPKETVRIFMFVDLRSSVRIAEELGHFKYSRLLQDCYYDLNTQLSRYKARVYQYVGDQAVIHWTPEGGLTNNNCIRFFFGFLERLEARQEYYHRLYGMQPYFKAGAHIGRVTIAEVGVLKRSIAFHGDTVNTTSRIHDQCNAYGQRMLVSKDLLSRLPYKDELHIAYIGDDVLKGKYRRLEIYGVSYKQEVPLPVA